MIYVFAGPSISKQDINQILPDAVVLPPIKAADLLNLLSDQKLPKPSHVHIIDGLFYSSLSVRHKEILYVISQGISVSGASSMGALRAAELSDYGMTGYGRVFDFYSSSPVTNDDEVAISHTSEPPFTPLTIPLINIRLSLQDLALAKAISPEVSDKVLDLCSCLHFSDRTKRNVINTLQQHSIDPELINQFSDWKHLDAVSSLYAIKNHYPVQPTTSPKQAFPAGTHILNYFNDVAL